MQRGDIEKTSSHNLDQSLINFIGQFKLPSKPSFKSELSDKIALFSKLEAKNINSFKYIEGLLNKEEDENLNQGFQNRIRKMRAGI